MDIMGVGRCTKRLSSEPVMELRGGTSCGGGCRLLSWLSASGHHGPLHWIIWEQTSVGACATAVKGLGISQVVGNYAGLLGYSQLQLSALWQTVCVFRLMLCVCNRGLGLDAAGQAAK